MIINCFSKPTIGRKNNIIDLSIKRKLINNYLKNKKLELTTTVIISILNIIGFYYFCIKYNMINNIPFLTSIVIIGIILFQSILIAPAINKLINIKDASILLRYIWPKFFLIIALLSLIAILTMSLVTNIKHPSIIFLIISFSLMVICFFITPLINKAKDLGDKKLWSTLHLTTIIATLITLILNILNTKYFLN